MHSIVFFDLQSYGKAISLDFCCNTACVYVRACLCSLFLAHGCACFWGICALAYFEKSFDFGDIFSLLLYRGVHWLSATKRCAEPRGASVLCAHFACAGSYCWQGTVRVFCVMCSYICICLFMFGCACVCDLVCMVCECDATGGKGYMVASESMRV